MDYRQFGNKYIVRIDKGEEVVESIKKICIENKITLGSITGLGAVDKAEIGLFETASKKFVSTQLTGDHEMSSITGNISTMNGELYLHIHASLADKNQKTYGGHLSKAIVSGTCELVIDVIDGCLDRKYDDEIGLNLYKFT